MRLYRVCAVFVSIITCCCILAVTGTAKADLIQIGAVKDNTLYEDSLGGLSNGLGQYTFAGTTSFNQVRRAVMAFDIAGSIPSGSTITGVALTLHMSKTISGNVPVSLHRLTADWGEGTSVGFGEEGAGGIATTGDATWTHSFSPTIAWTSLGGDFIAGDSATSIVGDIGYYTWGSSGLMVSDVQGWLNAPASNIGWLLRGDESALSTAKRFDSRDNLDPAVQPVLDITFIPVPEPSSLLLLALAFGIIPRSRRRNRKPIC